MALDLDDDAFTRVRIILMNGIEHEALLGIPVGNRGGGVSMETGNGARPQRRLSWSD